MFFFKNKRRGKEKHHTSTTTSSRTGRRTGVTFETSSCVVEFIQTAVEISSGSTRLPRFDSATSYRQELYIEIGNNWNTQTANAIIV